MEQVERKAFVPFCTGVEKAPLQIDMVGNYSTRFCVFLLTGNFHRPILHSQIRGNVEAPDGPVRDVGTVPLNPRNQPGF